MYAGRERSGGHLRNAAGRPLGGQAGAVPGGSELRIPNVSGLLQVRSHVSGELQAWTPRVTQAGSISKAAG